MIATIVNLFNEQAREHRLIKSFQYNRDYEIGSGGDNYPLLWLEDPIYGQNQNNIFTITVNFSILLIPENTNFFARFQNLAFSTGLNMIERIKRNKPGGVSVKPDWTYITLQNYYDDNACGCRFTVNLTHINMQNLCLIEEQFDTQKELSLTNMLQDFDLSTAPSLEIFEGKLPEFDILVSMVIKSIAEDIVMLMQTILQDDSIATNRKMGKNTLRDSILENSIKTEQSNVHEAVVIHLLMNNYIRYIENGRNPRSGKQPPISALREWALAKGIPADNTTLYRIARAIWRDGYKGRPILSTLDTQIDNRFDSRWADELFQSLANQLNDYFNS